MPPVLSCFLPSLIAVLFTATASRADDDVRLIYSGDIMLTDGPGKAVARGEDPFADFTRILNWADVRVGNLECVISTVGEPDKGKRFSFQVNPRALPLLEKHFDVVSLANNHTGDYGHAAFLQQLQFLEQHGIAHIGGGRNCVEARTPHMVKAKGLRIALLGYNDFHPRSFEAGPSWPGVAWSVDEQVVADIQAARTIHKADLVIPFMHWGEEHEPPNSRQRKLGRLMIDAGADVVVGSHPHCTQDPEYYKGHLILYSLGNFVFDGFGPGSGRTGWLLRMRLNKQGLVSWDTVVAKMNEEGVPHVDRDAASPAGVKGNARIVAQRAR